MAKVKSLDAYAAAFTRTYPKYTDARYKEIRDSVKIFARPGALEQAQSAEFNNACGLFLPLIELKNFKSQVPFPRNAQKAITCCIRIASAKAIRRSNKFAQLGELFLDLIEQEGFQLPTVSAVFHFSHPRAFPIVDVNVARACAILKKEFSARFKGISAPRLPSPKTSSSDKLARYHDFMKFIDMTSGLWRPGASAPSYRELDKALMVLGGGGVSEAS